jgi:hypothetical protein
MSSLVPNDNYRVFLNISTVLMGFQYLILTVITLVALAGLFGLEPDSLGWTALFAFVPAPFILLWLLLTGLVYLPKFFSPQTTVLLFLPIATICGAALSLHLSYIGLGIALIPTLIVGGKYYFRRTNDSTPNTTYSLTTGFQTQKSSHIILKIIAAIIGLLFIHWIFSLLFL